MINKKITYNPKYHRNEQKDISLRKNFYQKFRYGLIKRHYYYLSSRSRVLPNFFIVGGVRCGTTSLYHYLGQHNCISRAAYDELGYFDDNYHLGLNWYRSMFTTKSTKRNIEKEYGKFLTFDVTPFYIYNPLVVNRISKDFPNTKIIAALRNPIDRAYSNFNDRIQREGDTKTTFEEIIEYEMKVIQEENDNQDNEYLVNVFYELLLGRGLYAKQLEYWFKKIPKEQILIISSEKLQNNTEETLSEVFEFLEISKQDINDLTKQNKIGYPKMKDSTREVLNNFFKPYNEKLFNLLGKTFDWDDQK
mgnify:FL=1